MLHSVIRAPLTFFELTPSGRQVVLARIYACHLTCCVCLYSILNLFTKDTNVVDQALARVSVCSHSVAIPL